MRVFDGDAFEGYCNVNVQASRCSYSSSSEAGTKGAYEPVSHILLHSNPGAFIAHIAAINATFARGRMAKVSVNVVSGQTIMLTNSGQWKFVSANNADGTTA